MSKPIRKNFLAEEWALYRRSAFLRPVSNDEAWPVQQAFYAGAAGLFLFLTSASNLDQGDEPTDRDLAQMDAIEAELAAFVEQAAKGRPAED